MAIRTKVTLKQMVGVRLPDNVTKEITPATHRAMLLDLIDSLSAGISHFAASARVYEPATHRIVLTVAGYERDVGTIVFWVAPGDLDRDASALSLQIGTEIVPLLDVLGAPVGAHQLTPDALFSTQVLYAGNARRWKLTSTLEPRPPDPLGPSWMRPYEALADETADEIIAGGVTLAWVMAGYAAPAETATIVVPEPTFVGYPTAAIPASWWPLPFGYPSRLGTFGNARWTLLVADAGMHGGVVYSLIYLNSRQSARGLGGTFTLRPLPVAFGEMAGAIEDRWDVGGRRVICSGCDGLNAVSELTTTTEKLWVVGLCECGEVLYLCGETDGGRDG